MDGQMEPAQARPPSLTAQDERNNLAPFVVSPPNHMSGEAVAVIPTPPLDSCFRRNGCYTVVIAHAVTTPAKAGVYRRLLCSGLTYRSW